MLTLAAILHQFDLEPKPGYHLTIAETLTLKPADFQLRVHPRRRVGPDQPQASSGARLDLPGHLSDRR